MVRAGVHVRDDAPVGGQDPAEVAARHSRNRSGDHGVERCRYVAGAAGGAPINSGREEAAPPHAHGPISEPRKGHYGWQPCRDLFERGCGG